MIITLDTSAAIEFIISGKKKESIADIIKDAELIIAPSLFIYETINVFWKYTRFSDYPKSLAKRNIEQTLSLIDKFIYPLEYSGEILNISIYTKHSTYDSAYIQAAINYNTSLLTMDKKLSNIAQDLDIKTFII
jgi:predicted nucleic acid-binding protein